MKLKSCFLITLMACAFFSCSDNDDPVNLTITPVVPDATLSLAVQTDNRVKTKGGFIEGDAATEEKPTWDSQVKTLTAVIFNNGAYPAESNILEGRIAAIFTQNYTNPANETVIEGEVKSGDIHLLLIANLDAGVLEELTNSVNSTDPNKRLSVEDVLKLATPLSSETDDKGLTMSSAVLPLKLVPGTNFVGFGKRNAQIIDQTYGTGTEVYGENPVVLTRTVAAINLKGVLLPEIPEGNSDYKNVSFILDSVFVANVKSMAGIGTNDKVETIEQSPLKDNIFDTEYYLAPKKYASHTGTYKTGAAKGDDNMLRVLADPQEIKAKTKTTASTTELDWSNEIIPPCYVYPNEKGETDKDGKHNYTLLVLRGTYTYKIGDSTPVTEYNRYYTVIINDKSQGGTIDGNTGKTNVHIQRNTKYNVTVQILGSGSNDPFTPAAFAHVAAQVKVADWNVIEIEEDVD